MHPISEELKPDLSLCYSSKKLILVYNSSETNQNCSQRSIIASKVPIWAKNYNEPVIWCYRRCTKVGSNLRKQNEMVGFVCDYINKANKI